MYVFSYIHAKLHENAPHWICQLWKASDQKFSVRLKFSWKEFLLLVGGWFSVAVSHICFLNLCLYVFASSARCWSMVYSLLDFCFLAFTHQLQHTRICITGYVCIFKIKAKLLWVSWINSYSPLNIWHQGGLLSSIPRVYNCECVCVLYTSVCIYEQVYMCVRIMYIAMPFHVDSVYFRRCFGGVRHRERLRGGEEMGRGDGIKWDLEMPRTNDREFLCWFFFLGINPYVWLSLCRCCCLSLVIVLSYNQNWRLWQQNEQLRLSDKLSQINKSSHFMRTISSRTF